MIKWENKKDADISIACINSIEAAFKQEYNTRKWILRFDKNDNMDIPKILEITDEALRWKLNSVPDQPKIQYLKKFIPFYLKSLNYDFSRIPKIDLIDSRSKRLPSLNKMQDFSMK